MAIKIDLVADVKDVIKGTDKIGDALEDLADDLKDVGKEGQKVEDKVSDAFKDMAKDADRAGEKMDDSVSDAFRKMAQEAKDAGRTIGKEVNDGTDKAGEGLDDMKSEAAGTARETAASFGSIEDAAGALQEVAANAFAGFGPAGMAMGLVAAAGIGLATSAMTDNAEKINESKEGMLGLAQTIRDNGGVLTEADYIKNMEEYGYAIQDTKEWFEIFQSEAVSGFEQLRDLVEDTGLSTREIFRGGFGNAQEAKKTLDDVNKRLEELKEKKDAILQTTGSFVNAPDAKELTALQKAKELIEDNIQAQEDAAMVDRIRKGGVDELTDSIVDNREELRAAAEAKEEASENERDLAQYVSGTTEQYRAQVDAIEEVTDALKGAITSELDYMDSTAELKVKLEETGYAWDINTAKGRDNRRAVLDIASGIEDMARANIEAGQPIADVTAKFTAQKDALVNQVMPAFNGSREEAKKYIDQVLKTPPTATTKVQLKGKDQVRAELDSLARPIIVPLKPVGDHAVFESVLRSFTGRSVNVNLVARSGGPVLP